MFLIVYLLPAFQRAPSSFCDSAVHRPQMVYCARPTTVPFFFPLRILFSLLSPPLGYGSAGDLRVASFYTEPGVGFPNMAA